MYQHNNYYRKYTCTTQHVHASSLFLRENSQMVVAIEVVVPTERRSTLEGLKKDIYTYELEEKSTAEKTRKPLIDYI